MVNRKSSILIVDDEQVVCDLLYDELNERGYLCITALNVNDALTKLAAHDFDVALVDIKLPGISGMELLRKICSKHHNTAAIMVTGVNNIDTAVEAMKLGASDYVVKPFDLNRVSASIRTALENKKHSPRRGDYKTALCVGSEEDDRQTIEESFNQINAIARGVEVKLDSLTGFSKITTQRTVDIARQLGIAEAEIQKWVAARAKLDFEKKSQINSSLNKLERSPFAQAIMGMTELHRYIQKSSESPN